MHKKANCHQQEEVKEKRLWKSPSKVEEMVKRSIMFIQRERLLVVRPLCVVTDRGETRLKPGTEFCRSHRLLKSILRLSTSYSSTTLFFY